MSHDRPKRDSMSIEEATVSNMWEIAAIVEVFERKGLCTKQDLYNIIDRNVSTTLNHLPWEISVQPHLSESWQGEWSIATGGTRVESSATNLE